MHAQSSNQCGAISGCGERCVLPPDHVGTHRDRFYEATQAPREALERPMGFARDITPAERRDMYRSRDEKVYERMPCGCPIDSGCSGHHTAD